jgi:Glycogen recognition site of AMP-activated protein kinase
MLTRTAYDLGTFVTFRLTTDRPVSVVGDWNDWTPGINMLRPEADGVSEVNVLLQPGRHYFRYLADGGDFFDDPDADTIEANGYGDTHSVIDIAAAVHVLKLVSA